MSEQTFREILDSIPEQQERFRRALMGEVPEDEQIAAWRDYGQMIERAFRTGRLWVPEIAFYLTPLMLAAIAEAVEAKRLDRERMAAGDDETLLDQINATDESGGCYSLREVDGLALGLEVHADETRRRAGYLPLDIQPSPLQKPKPD